MLDLTEKRWNSVDDDMPKYAGFMSGMEKFDAEFFGFSPEFSNSMDPQSRMLLEHAYDAIFDAGMFKNLYQYLLARHMCFKIKKMSEKY